MQNDLPVDFPLRNNNGRTSFWKGTLSISLLLLPLLTQAQLPPAPADQRPLFPNEPAGLQRGAYHGQPVRYQTADQHWHDAQMSELRTDRVYLIDSGTTTARAYLPGEVRRLVTRDETYGVVGRYFARELFAAGPFTLYRYENLEAPPLLGAVDNKTWLRRGDQPLLKLSGNRRRFNRQMLGAVGDNARLAAQLQANKFRRRDVIDILQQYLGNEQ